MINKIDYDLILNGIDIDYRYNPYWFNRNVVGDTKYIATVHDTNNLMEFELVNITSYKSIQIGDKILYILYFINGLCIGMFGRN